MKIYGPIASFAAQSKAEEILLHPNCTQKGHESHRKRSFCQITSAILIHGLQYLVTKAELLP